MTSNRYRAQSGSAILKVLVLSSASMTGIFFLNKRAEFKANLEKNGDRNSSLRDIAQSHVGIVRDLFYRSVLRLTCTASQSSGLVRAHFPTQTLRQMVHSHL